MDDNYRLEQIEPGNPINDPVVPEPPQIPDDPNPYPVTDPPIDPSPAPNPDPFPTPPEPIPQFPPDITF